MGRMAGSTVRRELATCTSARARPARSCVSGLHAGAWLTTIPTELATTLPSKRLPPLLRLSRCGPSAGCGGLAHMLAKLVEASLKEGRERHRAN